MRAAPYIGDTSLLQSLWRICSAEGLVLRLTLLQTLPGPFADRAAMAQAARQAIIVALQSADAPG